MIHEHLEKQYDNTFKIIKPTLNDFVVYLKDKKLLLNSENELPHYDEKYQNLTYIYLFKMDEIGFFYCLETIEEYADFSYKTFSRNSSVKTRWLNYAISLADDFTCWYKENKYCGQCGKLNRYSNKERMLYCEDCKTMIFPRINPAVIVAVIDRQKKRIVCTKRTPKSTSSSLVSGFIETGESPEETCAREVMEEVGLKIKNIHYYKSQPWPFTRCLLLGYVCDLDGDDKITIDYNENADAYWLNPTEVGIVDNDFTLTREMLDEFAKGKL